MYQAISELPQPNRDTIAYLMIHLQAIAENYKVNKMDIDNISTVMGPTIVGYSTSEPGAGELLSEGPTQKKVIKALLGLSADYWSTFLSVEEENIFGVKVTPSNALNVNGGKMFYEPTFNPPVLSSAHKVGIARTPLTAGPVARRTRSRQLNNEFSMKSTIFQSPMLR